MARKLKVLIVDHAPVFGGVEAMIVDLIGAVDRDRFDLAVVADSHSQIEFNGATVLRTPLPSIRRNWGAVMTAGMRLAQIAKNADVMMTTTARTHAIGAVASRLCGVPLIWRLADDTFPSPLAAALSRIPKRIIAVSSFIAGRCSPSPGKTVVIPDGLPDLKPQTRLQLRRDKPLAVMVARLVRWKGGAVFARAVKLAGVVDGLIVGGEDDSEGELGGRGLKAELTALNPELRLLGQRSDLPEILAACDLFVHVSTRPEPFGRAVVQAMLAGLPVIATWAGAIPEVVGEAGRLLPAGDVESLAATLTMDEATRKRLGCEGRERALARFGLADSVRRLENEWRDTAQ
jgi:glycosyltransferase involved in cell wall biosynthesis